MCQHNSGLKAIRRYKEASVFCRALWWNVGHLEIFQATNPLSKAESLCTDMSMHLQNATTK